MLEMMEPMIKKMEAEEAEKAKVQAQLEEITLDISRHQKKIKEGEEEIEEQRRRIRVLDDQTRDVAAKRIQRPWRAKMARRKAREAMPPTPPLDPKSPSIPTGECRWKRCGSDEWRHMTSSEVQQDSSSGGSHIVFLIEDLIPKTEYEANTRWVSSMCEGSLENLENANTHIVLCQWGPTINFNTSE